MLWHYKSDGKKVSQKCSFLRKKGLIKYMGLLHLGFSLPIYILAFFVVVHKFKYF